MAKAKAAQAGPPQGPMPARVQWVLDWLKDHASAATRDGMARYAIPSDDAFGVTMKDMKTLGKRLGRDHALALALWQTGWYEARTVTAYVADPDQLTAAQMDRWCKDFNSWAVCDSLCFNLFDRSAHAWNKVAAWSDARGEFQRRAAFALLWSLALHDRNASEAQFRSGLQLIEAAADDQRNFVKKAVNMALRAIGRRGPRLKAAATTTAKRLAETPLPSARWIGKNALLELRK